MKKIFSIMVVLAFGATTALEAGCDTTQNVGQTIGICQEKHTPDYSYYSCTTTNEGTVFCYFWAPPT